MNLEFSAEASSKAYTPNYTETVSGGSIEEKQKQRRETPGKRVMAKIKGWHCKEEIFLKLIVSDQKKKRERNVTYCRATRRSPDSLLIKGGSRRPLEAGKGKIEREKEEDQR